MSLTWIKTVICCNISIYWEISQHGLTWGFSRGRIKPGGTPLYKPYRYVSPQNGCKFCPFWTGIGCGFWGNDGSVRTYLSFQFQMNKKEREMCECEIILRNLFCWCSNLSNDDLISAYARSENGWGNDWSEIRSGFREPQGTPPPRIPRVCGFAGWKMSGFISPYKKNKTEVKLFNSTDFELALVKLSPKHFCGTRLRQHFQHWYCSWQRCRCRLDKGIPGTLC